MSVRSRRPARCHLASLRIEPVPRSTQLQPPRLHDAGRRKPIPGPVVFQPPVCPQGTRAVEIVALFINGPPSGDGVRIRPEPVLLTLDLLPAARSIRTVGQLQLPAAVVDFPPRRELVRLGYALGISVAQLLQERLAFQLVAVALIRQECVLDDDAHDAGFATCLDDRVVVLDAAIGIVERAFAIHALRIAHFYAAVGQAECSQLLQDLAGELCALLVKLVTIRAVVRIPHFGTVARSRSGVKMQADEHVGSCVNRAVHALNKAHLFVASTRQHHFDVRIGLQRLLAVQRDLPCELPLNQTVGRSPGLATSVAGIQGNHELAGGAARARGGRTTCDGRSRFGGQLRSLLEGRCLLKLAVVGQCVHGHAAGRLIGQGKRFGLRLGHHERVGLALAGGQIHQQRAAVGGRRALHPFETVLPGLRNVYGEERRIARVLGSGRFDRRARRSRQRQFCGRQLDRLVVQRNHDELGTARAGGAFVEVHEAHRLPVGTESRRRGFGLAIGLGGFVRLSGLRALPLPRFGRSGSLFRHTLIDGRRLDDRVGCRIGDLGIGHRGHGSRGNERESQHNRQGQLGQSG